MHVKLAIQDVSFEATVESNVPEEMAVVYLAMNLMFPGDAQPLEDLKDLEDDLDDDLAQIGVLSNKIGLVRVIRDATQLLLKDCKKIVDQVAALPPTSHPEELANVYLSNGISLDQVIVIMTGSDKFFTPLPCPDKSCPDKDDLDPDCQACMKPAC